jgi:hypothetical protein
MKFSYLQVCQSLIYDLPKRQKEVILSRFGLKTKGRKTLESIGRDFAITRERVRQIEEDGLNKIKLKAQNCQEIFQYFKKYFRNYGDLRKEEIVLAELGERKWQNQVYFLLTLNSGFQRIGGTEDFYPFWTTNRNAFRKTQKVINLLSQKLKQSGKPLTLKELARLSKSCLDKLPQAAFASYLEISKKIQKNGDGLFGFKDWPEINPRGVKDRAYLLLKKENKPFHFGKLAELIEGSLVQTVHNELIRDPRFVLIGRGVYALREWGYEPGQVKDVILKILKENGKPLNKEEILNKVLKQRLVKENTVLLNLSNKDYFLRDPLGRYRVKEA